METDRYRSIDINWGFKSYIQGVENFDYSQNFNQIYGSLSPNNYRLNNELSSTGNVDLLYPYSKLLNFSVSG